MQITCTSLTAKSQLKRSQAFCSFSGGDTAIVYTFVYTTVLTLPPFFFFLLLLKKSIYFQWAFSCWNHCPLQKSIWFPDACVLDFGVGVPLRLVLISAELLSLNCSLHLPPDWWWVYHAPSSLRFSSQKNRDIGGNTAARKQWFWRLFFEMFGFLLCLGRRAET